MSKFTFKEKQLAVNLYLQGISSDKIVNDLNIASRSQLLFWVKQYKKHGVNALKEKRRHQEYDIEFKLEVLDWKAKTRHLMKLQLYTSVSLAHPLFINGIN